jgi:hypothetical protein
MTYRAFVVLLAVVSQCHAASVAVVDAPGFQEGVDGTVRLLSKGDPLQGAALVRLVADARIAPSPAASCAAVQVALNQKTQLEVEINPESRVKVALGGAACVLDSPGWNYRLLKVVNLAGVTAPLRVASPQARSGDAGSRDQWLDVELYGGDRPVEKLSGAKVEYRVVRLRSHAVGKRAAVISVDVGQGTADIGFRNDVLLTFTCSKVKE